jgi:cyclophilin family peptidyl-prolyl cis-trans isomerase
MPNTISANEDKDFSHLQAPQQPSENEIAQMENELYLFETTLGKVMIQLNPKAAPKTCLNFRNLIEAGFYDGIIFHRVIRDFMIQSGGYTVTGPRSVEYNFPDEINPEALGLDEETIERLESRGVEFDYSLPSMKHLQGVISMANAGPNTNGSQFFIVSKEDGAEWLNGMHTVFGHVVEGMDIVLAIEKVETDQADKPLEDVIITKAQIIVKEEAPEDPDETMTIILQIGSTKATVSGKAMEVDPPPFIRNNRTVVPIRFIAEGFGSEVQYDSRTKGINILFRNYLIVMQIGNEIMIANGKSLTLEVPPFIFENRTFVPLRAVSEAFGAKVQWEAKLLTIGITW